MAVTPVSGNQVQIAAAKQTAIGTANTTYTWFPRWGDGTVLSPELTTEDIRQGDGSPDIGYVMKKKQLYKGKIVHRTPRTIDLGFAVEAAFGTGSDTVTGAGPYTHTLTPKNTRESFTTAILYKPSNGGANIGHYITDAQFGSLKITGEVGMPILTEYDIVGVTGTQLSTLGTVTYDTDSVPIIYWGGSFTVDGSANTGQIAPFVRKFEITWGWASDEDIQTEKVTLDALVATLRVIDVKYEVLFQDYTQIKKVYWNAGTTDAAIIGTGALDLIFYPNGDNTQTKNVEIIVPSVSYKADKTPSPRLDGKGLFQQVEGLGIVPSSGAISTIILKNGQSTSY